MIVESKRLVRRADTSTMGNTGIPTAMSDRSYIFIGDEWSTVIDVVGVAKPDREIHAA